MDHKERVDLVGEAELSGWWMLFKKHVQCRTQEEKEKILERK